MNLTELLDTLIAGTEGYVNRISEELQDDDGMDIDDREGYMAAETKYLRAIQQAESLKRQLPEQPIVQVHIWEGCVEHVGTNLPGFINVAVHLLEHDSHCDDFQWHDHLIEEGEREDEVNLRQFEDLPALLPMRVKPIGPGDGSDRDEALGCNMRVFSASGSYCAENEDGVGEMIHYDGEWYGDDLREVVDRIQTWVESRPGYLGKHDSMVTDITDNVKGA